MKIINISFKVDYDWQPYFPKGKQVNCHLGTFSRGEIFLLITIALVACWRPVIIPGPIAIYMEMQAIQIVTISEMSKILQASSFEW